jgi:anti-anti-sigma factor
MSSVTEVGPLTVVCEGAAYRALFSTPADLYLEIPPDYDQTLQRQVLPLLAAPGATLRMDLGDVPALSSRQLGILLALQKALRSKLPRLPVTRVSEGVRRTMEMTRTAGFFEIV